MMIMILMTFKPEVDWKSCQNQQQQPKGYQTCVHLSDKVNHNESAWRQAKSQEERKRLSQQCILELIAAVETWSQNLKDGAFKNHGRPGLATQKQCCYSAVDVFFFIFCWRVVNVVKFLPVSLLIDKLLPLIIKWEWGTTGNFLYQYQGKKIDLVILITASRWKSVEEKV